MTAENDKSNRPIEAFPTSEDFFLNAPLYKSFQITDGALVHSLQFFKGGILDVHCLECGQHSIFHWTNNFDGYHNNPTDNRYFQVDFYCSRNQYHGMSFFFKVHNDTIAKVGQHPSIADLNSADIGKYRKILGNDKFREFSRAVGLVSHGVGIGAFVYLRRIFEDLIEEAHRAAASDSAWDEDPYVRSRMDEKILLLQHLLPTFLVENRRLYSILSRGVHSLTEEECLEYFEPIKLGIELILDEKIEQQAKLSKLDRVRKAIADITRKVSS